eukprot:GDKK01004728.1.p1 GENE.GDKK01004728.1~~GDKK01004728.1.p1  ORF type:complete len:228 (+),score=46.68 GDKK01004728.1:50-685(+)
MSYLLKIDVSPMGGNSSSLALGNHFVTTFSATNPDVEVRVRDLAATPLPHIDGEALTAGYVPEENRSEGMKSKHQLRLDLIQEISDAKSIVITTPMWNWSIPSVLKAYIDHIVLPGSLDPYGNKKLAGKKVTVLVATGGSYAADSHHPEWDFVTPYVKHIFTSLGSEDVQVIRAEFTLAGVAPGMEALIPKKEQSLADGKVAVEVRAAEAL